jgi:hypothetical protein
LAFISFSENRRRRVWVPKIKLWSSKTNTRRHPPYPPRRLFPIGKQANPLALNETNRDQKQTVEFTLTHTASCATRHFE